MVEERKNIYKTNLSHISIYDSTILSIESSICIKID